MAPGAYRAGEGWALHLGHAAGVLAALPEASVQTIVTSPPYYGLRDYRGHPEQLGQEPTPQAYVAALLGVLRAAARVLRPDGTLWLNLADSYASRANRGRSADRHGGHGHRRNVAASRINTTSTAPLKSLLLIPARVSLALVDDGWILRNDLIWHKPNALPHSVADRFTSRHEHLYLLARQPRYVFDLDAVKVPATGRAAGNRRRSAYAAAVGGDTAARRFGSNATSTLSTAAPETRNPGDVWTIATRGTNADHYAGFPAELPRRCIAAATRPGDLVLDPFAGCSTTGQAALTLGRRYLGIDINPEYHDLGAAALDAITTQHHPRREATP